MRLKISLDEIFLLFKKSFKIIKIIIVSLRKLFSSKRHPWFKRSSPNSFIETRLFHGNKDKITQYCRYVTIEKKIFSIKNKTITGHL